MKELNIGRRRLNSIMIIEIEDFSLFIREYNKNIKLKRTVSNTSTTQLNTVNSEVSLLKSKAIEYIKSKKKFNNKGVDILKSFFYTILTEFLKENKKLDRLSENMFISKEKEINIDAIISYMKIFYNFEAQLFISQVDIMKDVINNTAAPSDLLHLLIIISSMKIFDCSEIIYENELFIEDVLKGVMTMIDIINKSSNFLYETVTSNDESEKINLLIKYLTVVVKEILPILLFILGDFINDSEIKNLHILINLNIISKIVNSYWSFSIIRQNMYSFLFNVIQSKDYSKIKSLKKYILQNLIFEKMFFGINQLEISFEMKFAEEMKVFLMETYYEDDEDVGKKESFDNDIISNPQNLMIRDKIIIKIMNNILEYVENDDDIYVYMSNNSSRKGSDKVENNEILNSFSTKRSIKTSIQSESNTTTSLLKELKENFNQNMINLQIKPNEYQISTINFIIKELYFMSFIDKSDIKIKLSYNLLMNSNFSILSFSPSISLYKVKYYLDFLIEIYKKIKGKPNKKSEIIMKTIVKYLLDTELTSNKYFFIVSRTSFFSVFLSDIISAPVEVISYAFSCIIILYSESIENSSSYQYDKEIICLCENLKSSYKRYNENNHLVFHKNLTKIFELVYKFLSRQFVSSRLMTILLNSVVFNIQILEEVKKDDVDFEVKTLNSTSLIYMIYEIIKNLIQNISFQSSNFKNMNKVYEETLFNSLYYGNIQCLISINLSLFMNTSNNDLYQTCNSIKKCGFKFLELGMYNDKDISRVNSMLLNILQRFKSLSDYILELKSNLVLNNSSQNQDYNTYSNQILFFLKEIFFFSEALLSQDNDSNYINTLFNPSIDYEKIKSFNRISYKLFLYIKSIFNDMRESIYLDDYRIYDEYLNIIKLIQTERDSFYIRKFNYEIYNMSVLGQEDLVYRLIKPFNKNLIFDMLCLPLNEACYSKYFVKHIEEHLIFLILSSLDNEIKFEGDLYFEKEEKGKLTTILLKTKSIDDAIFVEIDNIVCIVNSFYNLIQKSTINDDELYSIYLNSFKVLQELFNKNEYNSKILHHNQKFFPCLVRIFQRLIENHIHFEDDSDSNPLLPIVSLLLTTITEILNLSMAFFQKDNIFDFLITLQSLDSYFQVNSHLITREIYKHYLELIISFKKNVSISNINSSGIRLTSSQVTNEDNKFNTIYAHSIKINPVSSQFSNRQTRFNIDNTQVKNTNNISNINTKNSYTFSILLCFTPIRTHNKSPYRILRLDMFDFTIIEFSIVFNNLLTIVNTQNLNENDNKPIQTNTETEPQQVLSCYLNFMSNSIKIELRHKKNNRFLFNFSSSEIEIFLNENLIHHSNTSLLTNNSTIKSLDSFNFSTGFSNSKTNLLEKPSSNNNLYVTDISLNYCLIYMDVLTIEQVLNLKYADILTGKNGSAKVGKTNIRSFNEVRYKMYTPNFNFQTQTDKIKVIDLMIDSNKITYELFFSPSSNIEILSNKNIYDLNTTEHEISLLFKSISKLIGYDISNEAYISYISNNSNFAYNNYTSRSNVNMSIAKDLSRNSKNEEKLFESLGNYKTFNMNFILNSTFLIKKCALSGRYIKNLSKDERILNSFSLIDGMSKRMNLFNSNISFFLLEDKSYLGNILEIMNETVDKKIFNLLFEVVIEILLNDVSKVYEFISDGRLSILKIIFLKKKHFLLKSTIDSILLISYGSRFSIDKFNFFNPIFPQFIYELLLDKFLFPRHAYYIKEYITYELYRILDKKRLSVIVNEGALFVLSNIIKCYLSILLIDDLTKKNDGSEENLEDDTCSAFKKRRESIITENQSLTKVICLFVVYLFESVIKNKNIEIEHKSFHISSILSYIIDYLYLTKYFKASVFSHLYSISNQDITENSHKIISLLFNSLYIDSDQIKEGRICLFIEVRELFRSIFNYHNQSKLISELKEILKFEFIQIFLDSKSDDVTFINEAYFSTILKSNANSNIDNSFVVVNSGGHDNDYDYNSTISSNDIFDIICIGESCIFCYFINTYMKDYMSLSIDYQKYKSFIINSYKKVYISMRKDQSILLKKKDISFSYYLSNKEGPSRIRNKLNLKVDYIKNDELQKEYYDTLQSNHNTYKISLENIFSIDSMDIDNSLMKILFLDRLFKLNLLQKLFSDYFISSGCISNRLIFNFKQSKLKPKNEINLSFLSKLSFNCLDSFTCFNNFDIGGYVSSFNCCLIDQLNMCESVFIIGTKKIMIMKNCYLSAEGCLRYVNKRKVFSLSFWSDVNYKNQLEQVCFSTDDYIVKSVFDSDYDNQNKDFLLKKDTFRSENHSKISEIKMRKFKREDESFQIHSFLTSEIIEIHKRKHLHQSNALEIFLLKGENFLIIFNTEIRDKVFSILLRQVIGFFDFSRKILENKFRSVFNFFSFDIQVFLNENQKNSLLIERKSLFNNTLGLSPSKKQILTMFYNLNSFSTQKMDPIMDSYTLIPISSSLRTSLNHNYGEFKFPMNSLLSLTTVFYSGINKSIIFKRKKNCVINSCEPGLVDGKSALVEIIPYWENGIILNFDYLMILNTFSGRSYNDLSSYFIMPWILGDYISDGLNLYNKDIYRKLNKPIHAVSKDSNTLLDKYNEADDDFKFHSGSHYSTSGFICYFLIRTKPFAYTSAEIQGGNFDLADRLFTNIGSIWSVNEKYQELIPEMFICSESFVNIHNFKPGHWTVFWSTSK